METLPNLCIREGLPIDSVRRLVREDAALRDLGTRLGATRCYKPSEVQQIVAAWRQRRQKRSGAAAGA